MCSTFPDWEELVLKWAFLGSQLAMPLSFVPRSALGGGLGGLRAYFVTDVKANSESRARSPCSNCVPFDGTKKLHVNCPYPAVVRLVENESGEKKHLED